MRTTLDRVAVLLMISACCFGCRSGTGGGNMFAWGKKKPDAGGEAPKYESTTLPTAGQNPMNSLNQVAGNNTGNSAQPTGYQPSGYPQTPYGTANLASANVAPPANNTAAPAPAYGAPPATGTQPQMGPYNPSYNAVASTTSPPANYGPPSGYGSPPPAYAGAPTAPTDVSMNSHSQPVGGPDYRMADSRNTSPGAAPAYGGAPTMPASPPATAAPNNFGASSHTSPPPADKSMVGDRYANIPMGPTEPATTGERYNSPPSDYQPGNTGYQPGATGYQPGASANPVGDTGYRAPANTSYGESSPNSSPLRQDPGYSPGGTGRYTPQNTLRPSTGSAAPESNDRYPASGVLPAHYETSESSAPGSVTPASGASPVEDQKPADDRNSAGEHYGPYQGAQTGSPPELFPNHAF